MGYYHTYNGSFRTKDMTEEDIHTAEELLEACWFDNPYDGDFNGEVSIDGYNKYYDESIREFLDFIAPFTTSGEIECVGDDGSQWAYVFDEKKKAWDERIGSTYYPSDDERTVVLTASEIDYLFAILENINEADHDPDELGMIEGLRDKLR